ncbi:MAG: TfoX/Sxy family protein [Spirochaeta sp.]
MAVSEEFIEYVCGQMQGAGEIRSRKMFGGCSLYCNGKVVGLITDDCLYIKPTNAGRQFIGTPAEAPPYEGAKPYFVVEDELENAEWLTELVRLTELELPKPRRKQLRC